MSYAAGSREQTMLLPESIGEYVRANEAVRVIDAFVEGLDWAWVSNLK